MNVNSVGWNLPPLENQDSPAPIAPATVAPGFIPSYPNVVQPPPEAVTASNGSSMVPQWLPGSDGSVPPSALIGGKDVDGENLYIGRARYGGGLFPGKFKPRHRGCYVGFGGSEHLVKHYEVLCAIPHEWIETRKDEIPPGALEAGYAETGERLYIGRIRHKGSMCIGKVHPSHKCLYISFGGKEIAYKSYQIFVPNPQ